ncbi:unnamed protein product [Somion occarium]
MKRRCSLLTIVSPSAAKPVGDFPAMLTQLLFATLFLASTVLTNPIVGRGKSVTLSFARHLNFTGTVNILQKDQARAHELKTKQRNILHDKIPTSAAFGIPATNQAVDYVVNVGVGNPPTQYSLLVDTGSSNTWLGAGASYVITDTSIDTGDLVFVEYGSGLFIGEEFLDQVTLAPDFVISNQSIGVAELALGFDGVDGILGIGPQDLTVGTLSPDSDAAIPTVTDNAVTQGLIDTGLVGVSFEPTNSLSVTNGEISFGAVDDSKYTGSIQYTPITATSPASFYVGIDQSISYGSDSIPILNSTAGITDTGTTLILIASDAIAQYQQVTGAVPDSSTGLLRITPAQYDSLESLFFNIGGESYELIPNAQIWPRILNTAIGGTNDFVYLIVADIGSLSGEGLDFIDGMTFLERFYSAFDSENNQFGLATTTFTNAITN